MAGRRNKRPTNGAPHIAANGNVLQIRVAGTQAPRSSDRLVEAGVNAPSLRIDRLAQRHQVGAHQLRQLSILKNLRRQQRLHRWIERQFLQDLYIR